jgi:hypothetical protein
MFPLILFVLLSQTGGDSPEPSFGVLVTGTGSGSITQGLKTVTADSLTAYPGAAYQDNSLDLRLTGRIDLLPDSTGSSFEPVTAGAFYRYPGSPWLSAGVFRGMADPFLPGLGEPVSEWGSQGVLQKNGFRTEAGGVLGFQGFWSQYSDTLSWYGVRSPWMGFGMGEWNVLQGDTIRTESYSAFLRFRRFRPWFNAVSREDEWFLKLQIRGLRSQFFGLQMEIVPAAGSAPDSTEFSLSILAKGVRRAFSGHATASVDPDSPGEAHIMAGCALTSRAGIDWSALLEREGTGDMEGHLEGQMRSFPAGFGGRLGFADSEAYLTATAFYSPVRGVSSILAVTSRLKTSSPEPSCVLSITGAHRLGTAVLELEWTGEETLLNLGVSAWIN